MEATSIRKARNRDTFAAADAGLAGVPAEVGEARTSFETIDAAVDAHAKTTPQPPEALRQQLAHDLVASARSGSVELDPSGVVALEVAEREHATRWSILDRARDLAAGELSEAIEAHTDQTVELLQVAYDALVAEAKALVAKLDGVELSDAAMLTASTGTRKAWVDLGDVVSKLSLLRRTRGALVRPMLGDPGRNDVTGVFGEVRNAEQVWADVGIAPTSLLTADKAPWADSDPKRRLVKMLTMGAQLWLPTYPEEEARWYEIYGTKVEEAAVSRQRARAAKAAFG